MANLDPNSAIGQAQSANNVFAQFFSDVYQAHFGTGDFPEFSDVVASLDYSELHRIAVNGQMGNANYSDAAAIDNVHQMVAVGREYGLRTKGKLQYYGDGQNDALNESNFHATMKTMYVNMLRGVFVPGGTL